MKKMVTLLLTMFVLCCLVSCGEAPPQETQEPRFEDQTAMFSYLDGMWIADDPDEIEYYVFRDGRTYYTSDDTFEYELEQLMDTIQKKQGIEALVKLDHSTAVETLGIETLLRALGGSISIDPQKGLIIIDESGEAEGLSIVTHIVVEENTIVVKDAGADRGTTFTKMSDEVDFSGEHFAEFFKKTKANYAVPTKNYWINIKDYANMVRANNEETAGWVLYSDTKESTIYVDSGMVPNMEGSLIISRDSLTFTSKISLTYDIEPTLTIIYKPSNNSIWIMQQDDLMLDLNSLILYGTFATLRFPNALDHETLFDMFQNESTVENGIRQLKKTIHGMTYDIQVGVTASWATVSIEASDTLKLSDFIDRTQGSTTTAPGGTTDEPSPEKSFSEALDLSKVWKTTWTDSQAMYEALYAFEEDGKCCMVISWEGLEAVVGFSGEYTVSDDTVTMRFECADKSTISYAYSFDPEDMTFTQISDEGLADSHKKGDTFSLVEDEYNTVDKIKTIVQTLSDTTETDGPPDEDRTSDSSEPMDATQPSYDPNDTQTAPVCDHEFTVATCTAPKTCKICGAVEGYAAGHDYVDATCTSPKTCRICGGTEGTVSEHHWEEVVETIHHDEEGHFEDIQIAKKTQKYRCWLCSYSQPTYDTLDAYYDHFDNGHVDEPNKSFFRERYELVDDWVYEYETQWVVDAPAYSERIVTGRKCDICGEEQRY